MSDCYLTETRGELLAAKKEMEQVALVVVLT